ncbi:MAG: hypothetical protein ACI8S6_002092 [Myxococcota bacterium]|jgi:hypothetical protein
MAQAWPGELGRLHRLGMMMGLSDLQIGEVYEDHVAAPSLRAFAQLLERYHRDGQLHVPSPAAAAASLYAPVLFALLRPAHRGELSATDFITAHIDLFVRGCAPSGQK